MLSFSMDGADATLKEDLCGAEPFLAGLAPQYWAHAPLTIRTLHSLGLVNGMDCLILNSRNLTTTGTIKCIPLSKCEMVGVIVNADVKSNGSCLYLVDDGTGLVDVMAWADSDVYRLPPLVESNNDTSRYKVGDRVRVLGKIKCVSIGAVRETVNQGGTMLEIRDCVREVHATRITALHPSRKSLNLESHFWLRCSQFLQQLENRSDLNDETEHGPSVGANGGDAEYDQLLHQTWKESIGNGVDVLQQLGPEIRAKALLRMDFPSRDDAVGAWRLFGTGCTCQLSFKESLLYCHCHATLDSLDSQFVFRDALLEFLLQMETNLPSETSRLLFEYKSVVETPVLVQVAEQVALKLKSTTGTTNGAAVHVSRLFIKTFSALRKDGILCLVDAVSDTYLLVSRARVLEPYLRSLLEEDGSSSSKARKKPPAYIACAPDARIQYLKRLLLAKIE